jgi:hypothetical protein
VLGNLDAAAVEVVVPVVAPQIAGIRTLRVRIADLARIDRCWVGELRERRQRDLALGEPTDAVGQRDVVDDPVSEPEARLEDVAVHGHTSHSVVPVACRAHSL